MFPIEVNKGSPYHFKEVTFSDIQESGYNNS